jgi:hypothetical protein
MEIVAMRAAASLIHLDQTFPCTAAPANLGSGSVPIVAVPLMLSATENATDIGSFAQAQMGLLIHFRVCELLLAPFPTKRLSE